MLLLYFRENAVFSCPTEGCCDGKTSNSTYISVHVAGASEATTVGQEFTCYTCGSQLVEDVSCRTLAGYDMLIVRVAELDDSSKCPCQLW